MRENAPLFADASSTNKIGRVTSGSFGPSVNGPVAMGYVPTPLASPGTELFTDLRGQRLPMHVAKLPFVAPTYQR